MPQLHPYFAPKLQQIRPIFAPIVLAASALVGCQAAPRTLAGTAQSTAATKTAAARPKIALVLGGGGLRGFAHVGAISALEQNGIVPDIVIGTSFGALVATMYDGRTADALTQLAYTVPSDELLQIAPSHQGLLDGAPLRDFINRHYLGSTTSKGAKNAGKYSKTLGIVATNSAGKAVLFTIKNGQIVAPEFAANAAKPRDKNTPSTDIGQLVQASASVPVLFIAPRIGGEKYYDGGGSALVPSRFARQLGADVVIAVDILAAPATANNARTSALSDLLILGKVPPIVLTLLGKKPQQLPTMNAADTAATDVLIIPDLADESVLAERDKSVLMNKGARATTAKMPEILAAIAQANRQTKLGKTN